MLIRINISKNILKNWELSTIHPSLAAPNCNSNDLIGIGPPVESSHYQDVAR